MSARASNVIAFPLGGPAPAHRDVKPAKVSAPPTASVAIVSDVERQAAAAELDQVLGYAGAGARALERWGRPADASEARGLCSRCRMHRVLGVDGRCEPCAPYDATEERGG